MGLWSTIRSALGSWVGGKALRENVKTELKEDFEPEFEDRDENLFRMLGPRRRRGLSDFRHRRQLEIVHHFWLSNPMARRIIETKKDWVIGEGLTFKAEDPEVQKILERHWNDARNQWPLKQFTKVMELGLYGEQAWPAAVTKINGLVRLGYLDPLEVEDVEHAPGDMSQPLRLVVADQFGTGEGTDSRAEGGADQTGPSEKTRLKIIRKDTDPESPTFGYRVGEVFYFKVNVVENEPRGTSDLLPLIDWLDIYDQFLFAAHERAQLNISVFWDVLMKGASEKKLEQMRLKYGKIVPGSIRFHNENVETKAVSPNLGASDIKAHADMIKMLIATGAGLPFHWLSEGGEANLATAQAMGGPTLKQLKARQLFVVNMISEVFEFVIDQAIIAERLDSKVNRKFKIDVPPLETDDIIGGAGVLATAMTGLQTAELMGVATQEELRRIFVMVAGSLGVELPEELPEELKGREPPEPGIEPGFDDLFLTQEERMAKELEEQRKKDEELKKRSAARVGYS
jgi:hypothetical protein